VIPVEGEEGTELHPTITQFFVGVAVETASVYSKHWYPEQGERQGLWDGKEHIKKVRSIVTAPFPEISLHVYKEREVLVCGFEW